MVYQAVGIKQDRASKTKDPEDYRAAEELAGRSPVIKEKLEADQCELLTKDVFQRLWDEEILKICPTGDARIYGRFGTGENGRNSFVNQNYLQDFVSGGREGHRYGCPKELWEGL